jgi:hypothetical protein
MQPSSRIKSFWVKKKTTHLSVESCAMTSKELERVLKATIRWEPKSHPPHQPWAVLAPNFALGPQVGRLELFCTESTEKGPKWNYCSWIIVKELLLSSSSQHQTIVLSLLFFFSWFASDGFPLSLLLQFATSNLQVGRSVKSTSWAYYYLPY